MIPWFHGCAVGSGWGWLEKERHKPVSPLSNRPSPGMSPSTLTSRSPAQAAPLSRSLQQRNARIERYRQVVRPIALHYHRRCAEPLDDLIQVGLLGLLRAAELYCRQRQTPFDAFARPHVRGAILHYLRDQAAAVRLPRRLEEQHHQLNRLQRQGCAPGPADRFRQEMGLNVEQWQRLLESRQHRRTLSLDQLLLDPSEAEKLVGSSGAEAGEGAAFPNALQLLTQLEADQRAVLERVVLAGWSYRRTGQALAISPMTVQRRLRRGLERLRELLNPEGTHCHRAASVAPAC